MSLRGFRHRGGWLGARLLLAAGLALGVSLPGSLRADDLVKLLEADLRAQDAAAANDAMTTGALGEGTPVPVSPGTAPGANGAAITSIRLGDHGAQTRFVMEFAGEASADYRVFTLSDPYRVVIDIKGVPFNLIDEPAVKDKGFVSGYRYGRFEADTWRVVIDADQPVEVARDFVLDPQSGFGRRVVLDLAPTDLASFNEKAGLPAGSPDTAAEAATGLAAVAAVPVSPPAERLERRRVVVIDAGHGGVDPGTHGRSGVQEKNVVLAFARQFAEELRSSGRYDVHLTRDSDIFLPLRERVAIARRHKADLFISVHADAIEKPTVRGMSVYTLSETSSDKEAAALARKENQSDVIAGLDLQGESPEVTGILIDLAQRETKNYSSRFAKSVVDYASQKTRTLDPAHRFAGFVVLKAPDVPSVLVELGFLTNPEDEKQLTSATWRAEMARTLSRAVDRYFGDRLAEGPN
ncbi:N-acetylmuramoyl-L-alanine amidase [Parvibaculum sp.]|jgi:N-acetylmuramoyl-L-alanine amidase|uniref:N-acetylmuramoyl-L-alanine amidase n=2 Tax=Parvibaculum sp. TaxID=2024848 RepID=UPI001B1CBCF9|nr:N-acetylmuramoyl-L-alanine amidase [Parvibaculum sp.]MBO6634106.1 N-acetylmuramoyl-L-alanine amidase [Parvibaculum sp.]MBO6678978.1 N-acetylmuramoyl-L-alanine amidase [Parvibaculum sp.]MBO6905736.1 N-acetylmuramoyl-L-alanine amidase [Parvibaculum sp.]